MNEVDPLIGALLRRALVGLPFAVLWMYRSWKRLGERGFSWDNEYAFLLAAGLGIILFLCYPLLRDRYGSSSRARAQHVERVPGSGLRRFAQLCFSRKVYGRVFEPILSDLLLEYFEALAEGDRVKAQFVLARGYWAFWLAFVAQLPVSFAKVVVELWIASKD